MEERDELYEQGMAAYNAKNYDEAIEKFSEAAELGHVDAKAFLALTVYMYACQIQNETIQYKDAEKLLQGQGIAAHMCYDVVRIAINYLSTTPEDSATCNLMGQLITQAFGVIYYIAANGYGIGYKVIEDGIQLDWALIINHVGLFHYSDYHQETTTLWSSNFHDYSIFGIDDKTKRIEQVCKDTLRNAKDIAKILEVLGRNYDALMLRARMALEMSDYVNGNRTYLLAAEWLYNQAISEARTALIGEDGDESVFQNWKDDHVQTNQKFAQMTSKFRKVIMGYKKEGKKPAIRAFYREDDTIPGIEESVTYNAMESADIELANDDESGIAKERFLSVVAQIHFKRFIPMIIFASIVGFFMGGLIPIYVSGGIFAKVFATVWFIITMILTIIRSVTVADGIASGKSYKTFQLFMICGTAFLCLHLITFIIGIIAFIILKNMARKYE